MSSVWRPTQLLSDESYCFKISTFRFTGYSTDNALGVGNASLRILFWRGQEQKHQGLCGPWEEHVPEDAKVALPTDKEATERKHLRFSAASPTSGCP